MERHEMHLNYKENHNRQQNMQFKYDMLGYFLLIKKLN
jgi:hypothetical protein